MHTKGTAVQFIRDRLKLDCSICLGNDLNDISMFSKALENDDFIVIANCEEPKITKMIIDYLKEECRAKNIDWEKVKLLVLEDKDVNQFLYKMNRILSNIKNIKNKKEQTRKNDYKSTKAVGLKKQNGKNRSKKRSADGRYI